MVARNRSRSESLPEDWSPWLSHGKRPVWVLYIANSAELPTWLSPDILVVPIMYLDDVLHILRLQIVLLPMPALPQHSIEEHLLRRVLPVFSCRAVFGDAGRLPGCVKWKGLSFSWQLVGGWHHIGSVNVRTATRTILLLWRCYTLTLICSCMGQVELVGTWLLESIGQVLWIYQKLVGLFSHSPFN